MTIDIIKHNKEVAVNLQQLAASHASATHNTMDWLYQHQVNYPPHAWKQEAEFEAHCQCQAAALYAAAREAYFSYCHELWSKKLRGTSGYFPYEFGAPE